MVENQYDRHVDCILIKLSVCLSLQILQWSQLLILLSNQVKVTIHTKPKPMSGPHLLYTLMLCLNISLACNLLSMIQWCVMTLTKGRGSRSQCTQS